MARAFGLVDHACVTKSEKCEKEGKAYGFTFKELENVSMFLNPTECKDVVVSQDDHMLYLLH